MFITIPNKYNLPRQQLQAAIKQQAVLNILSTALRTSQILLDKLLQKQHFKNLKTVCFQLITGSQCSASTQEAMVIFRKKQQDELAQLITYGNGLVGGSQILVNAFKNAATKIKKPVDLAQANQELEKEDSE